MIIYSNSDYVIINKPSRMDSEKGVVNALQEQLGQTVYPVHRLDKPVRGLMVFALNQKMAAELSLQMREHVFNKEYLLICEGSFKQEQGQMEDLLYFDRQRVKGYVVNRKRTGVKEASLAYQVISQNDGLAKVRVMLHTGRTHQIRIQFASRNHPLLGDRTYGSRIAYDGIALYSCFLSFVYEGNRVTYELIPEGFGGEDVVEENVG